MDRRRGERLAIAEQRVLFAGERAERGACEPRALNKLELPRDIGI
jgi:hypothetical protein